MPNIKSAIKELRKSKKLADHNRNITKKMTDLIKKTRKAIDKKEKEAEKLLKDTLKAIDKAGQKGIIKRNTRDRKKSRLQQKFNQIFKASK